jgi:phosphogluconate dehydratase
VVEAKVDPATWAAREAVTVDLDHYHHGIGRELFAAFRAHVGAADTGASIFAAA